MASSSVASASNKINLNFAWQGPNRFGGGSSTSGGLDIGVIDLVFKGATTQVSVHLPNSINPGTPQKFAFTCRRPLKETHPKSLTVTLEQVNNLVIKVGFFEKGRPIGPKVMDMFGKITQQETVIRSDREIRMKVPAELECDKSYTLVVSSTTDLSLSASLLKEETKSHSTFKVPSPTSAEWASDLEKLSDDEIKFRFDEVCVKDKNFEIRRLKAGLAGDAAEVHRVLEEELPNSQLLLKLADVLKNRGKIVLFPDSEAYISAAHESAKLHQMLFIKMKEQE